MVFSYGDLIDRHLLSWLNISGNTISVKSESDLCEHYDIISCCSSCTTAPCKRIKRNDNIGCSFDPSVASYWLAVGGKDAIVSLWKIEKVLKEGGFLNTGKKEECEISLYKLITGFENSITTVDYEPSLQLLVCGDRKGTCYWRSVSSGCLVASISMNSLLFPLIKESIKSFQFIKQKILSDGNTIIFAQYKLHHKIQYIVVKTRYSTIISHRIFSQEQLLSDIFIDETMDAFVVCHEEGFYCCSLSNFEVNIVLTV